MAISVLNAGSSSAKFSLFVARNDDLDLHVRSQFEEIDTALHFTAKRRDGAPATEKSWPDRTNLGHDGTLDHLIAFLRAELGAIASSASVIASPTADRSSHSRVIVDATVAAALDKLIPLAPLHFLRATTRELGPTRDAVLEAVTTRVELSRKQAADAYGLAEQFEKNPRSVCGYVQELTRLSQRTPWQHQRFTLDRAASFSAASTLARWCASNSSHARPCRRIGHITPAVAH